MLANEFLEGPASKQFERLLELVHAEQEEPQTGR